MLLGMAAALALAAPAVSGPCAEAPVYANRNQVDYTVAVRDIRGQALDPDGVAVPDACVAVFSESDHRLIVSGRTDSEGHFVLPHIPEGHYRLVVNDSVFCPVNARLHVGHGGKRLRLNLRLADIDTCSYASVTR